MTRRIDSLLLKMRWYGFCVGISEKHLYDSGWGSLLMSIAIERTRSLRKKQTDAENAIWQKIRNNQLGWKFRRQVPVGIYTIDFLCLDLKLIIEIDGGQHAESKKDEIRTRFLNGLGYKVIRFWNNDVLENMEGVLSTLILTFSQREKEHR